MARPQAEFNQQYIENMLKIMCTQAEICSIYQCSPNTLKRWIRDTYGPDMNFEKLAAKFRGQGKESLRRIGFDLARKGSTTAWIFLAKNYLGMSDNPVPQNSGEDKKELEGAIRDGLKTIKKMGAENIAQFPMKDDVDEEK